MIYIASPYGHEDKAVVQARMEKVYEVTAKLMQEGNHVVNPLAMHEVVIRHKLPETFDYWQDYCLDLLERCDEMYVITQKGWTTSVGVQAEIKFCTEFNIPITYVEVEDES